MVGSLLLLLTQANQIFLQTVALSRNSLYVFQLFGQTHARLL